ncbi:uncharacterized protein PHALS_02372 [Plasmopara halstedii]|uniref:Uncharacterized protein n=1 Tax=Plasmopara halstedii TaxID=4781 RepID=A0A0P1AUT4_PLAHL|nr:uncharacterized protein PHALS_02372 [Plasmopara halstedii]CEG46049.1 hypothetical protein PHALS_02372 [Plasmopara halstedii]|eukprot:XP_024582418.1 hypothetical protein PHALS_02372 [Plasmopara halstedii]
MENRGLLGEERSQRTFDSRKLDLTVQVKIAQLRAHEAAPHLLTQSSREKGIIPLEITRCAAAGVFPC